MNKSMVRTGVGVVLLGVLVTGCSSGGGATSHSGASKSGSSFRTVNDAVAALKSAGICVTTDKDNTGTGVMGHPDVTQKYHADTAVGCYDQKHVPTLAIQGFPTAADRDGAASAAASFGHDPLYAGTGANLWLMSISSGATAATVKALDNQLRHLQ